MGGRADGAGQQAGHPLAHHGGGRAVGQLALEEGEPLGVAVASSPRAPGQSSSASGRAGGGASSRRVRYPATQPSMASSRPRWASASAAMGPWLARPSGPYSGAVAAKTVRASSSSVRRSPSPCRPSMAKRHGPGARVRRPLRSGLRRREVRWRRRHHCTGCGSSSARPWGRRPSPRRWSTSGADVIKIEPPAGDYIREMTWPIVEGISLMHLHLNRGKRSLVLDLRTDAGVGHPQGAGRGGRRRGRGHAPGLAGPARRRLRGPAGHQPQDRLLHHLGLRHDRSLPRLPEPRRGLRHLGRHRQRGHRRRGFHLHPRARLHRDQRRSRSSGRSASWPR